jgi:putative pantetheine hydrolase
VTPGRGGWWGSITDVPGVRAGHAQRRGDGWLTGVTVVLPPPGTVGAVDVRGGGPATHETDALQPSSLVPTVDAVTLTGGSAYGLASARGVQRWCEEHGIGYAVGPEHDRGSLVVPIVPAAAVFDLGRGGDPSARPDADLGYEAAVAAATGTGAQRGCIGAGTGAVLARQTLKGGVGTASVALPGGVVVGALAVGNAFGTPLDARGGLLGAAFVPDGLPVPSRPAPAAPGGPGADGVPGTNTTLAVVATNANLDPARTQRTAMAAQDGLARALRPAHTLLDGDCVFALATGRVDVDGPGLVAVQAAAADAVLLAVLDAVLAATATRTAALDLPGYLDRYPPLDPRPGTDAD